MGSTQFFCRTFWNLKRLKELSRYKAGLSKIDFTISKLPIYTECQKFIAVSIQIKLIQTHRKLGVILKKALQIALKIESLVYPTVLWLDLIRHNMLSMKTPDFAQDTQILTNSTESLPLKEQLSRIMATPEIEFLRINRTMRRDMANSFKLMKMSLSKLLM